MLMDFNDEYPDRPPKCTFTPALFHPNVHASGMVSLSIIGKNWKPQVMIKQILIEVQKMLSEQNLTEQTVNENSNVDGTSDAH